MHGYSKYRNGNIPWPQPKICSYSVLKTMASPKQNNSLLWKLILRPDNCSNAHSKSFRFFACSRLFSIKRIVSSAYCKTERPLSTRCGTIPLNYWFSLALAIKIASMSTTILKSMGDSGSPCLTHFLVWK